VSALYDAVCSQLSSSDAADCKSLAHAPLRTQVTEFGGVVWGDSAITEIGFRADKIDQRPSSYEVPEVEITAGFCHPGRVLQLLGPKLGEGAVVCVDVGDVTLWTSLCLCLTKPQQRLLTSMRLGTMGCSVCAAMAAGALRPESQIVAIAGDGGVQMATNELETLRQMGFKRLLVIVFVNGKLGRVANEIWGPDGAPPPAGCQITNPDFKKLAEAHGGTGMGLADSNPLAVQAALDQALACEGLCILEVMQDPDVKPLMVKKPMSPKTPAHRRSLRNFANVQDAAEEKIDNPLCIEPVSGLPGAVS